MSFTEPQSVPISGTTHVLNRTGSGVNSGSFSTSDGAVKMSVSSSYKKRTRRQLRIDHTKVAADPLISAQSVRYSMTAYLVVDTPITGYTVAEATAVVEGLIRSLTGVSTHTAGVNVTKLLGGEN